MKSFTALLVLLGAASLASAASASAAYHAQYGHAQHGKVIRHRRHHARDTATLARRTTVPKTKRGSSGKCKSKSKGKSSGSSSSGSSNSTSSSSGSSSGKTSNYPAKAVQVGGVYIGMLPDGGTDGGPANTMQQLNSLISDAGTHATYGQYAQAQGGTLFTGGQLTQVMDDLVNSGAIFEPAVMPTPGSAGNSWWGLTSSDNQQAVAICKVMKQFTDKGIETRLRFAHEVNWYQSDGTYSGNAQDFIEGWNTVAAACKEIAPEVKLFWTPNISNLGVYDSFAPDMSTVSFIGVDMYPNQGSDLSTAFVQAMQPFHDKYCSDTLKFALGETGLGWAGSADQRMQWLQSITAAKSEMQHLTSVSWFNYQKGYDFKVCDPANSDVTGQYVSFLQSSS